MTSEDVRSELEKEPFLPLRFHLGSGTMIEIATADTATLLQNAVLILHEVRRAEGETEGYDVIALRNIERLERLGVP